MPKSTPTQTASERKAAEAELKLLIAKYAPDHSKLIATIRKSLQTKMPTAHEIVYEYNGFFVICFSPNEHGYEGVLGIRAETKGIKLFFNKANDLPDPDRLLKGTGKLVRSIDVDNASTLKLKAIANIIEVAIGRVKLAKTGPGPIIIRSTKARTKK